MALSSPWLQGSQIGLELKCTETDLKKSKSFVPFGVNLTQFGCQIWHPCCSLWNTYIRAGRLGKQILHQMGDKYVTTPLQVGTRSSKFILSYWTNISYRSGQIWEILKNVTDLSSKCCGYLFCPTEGCLICAKVVRLEVNGTNPGIFHNYILTRGWLGYLTSLGYQRFTYWNTKCSRFYTHKNAGSTPDVIPLNFSHNFGAIWLNLGQNLTSPVQLMPNQTPLNK